MATYTEKFKSVAAAYRGASIEFPKLKPVTIAQWMYESGRGSSKLATDHNNFAGKIRISHRRTRRKLSST